MGGGPRAPSGVTETFHISIWVVVTWLHAPNCTLKICVFPYGKNTSLVEKKITDDLSIKMTV